MLNLFLSLLAKVVDKLRKRLLVFCVLFCLVLSACRIGEASENSNGSETRDISALLFKQEDIIEVLIQVGRTYSNNVCIVTNETERTAILKRLYDADISGFSETELTGVMGAAVSFTIRAEGTERDLQIISDSRAQYIVVTDADGKRICKKGPGDSFDFKELNQLVTEVLGNEDDPDYAGTVTIKALEFEGAVNKGNCAFVRSILDGALVEAEADVNADVLYDIEFKVGDVIYGINSETGLFYRNNLGEMMYAQIENQKLTVVKTRLGIFTATT